jgi:hypothetical protein
LAGQDSCTSSRKSGIRHSSFEFIKSYRRTLPGLVSCVSPALMKQPSGLSARSVAANALGLGPRDRRCKSCRADHFRNGLMDEWMGGISGFNPRPSPAHQSNYPLIQKSSPRRCRGRNRRGIRLLNESMRVRLLPAAPISNARWCQSSSAAC